MTMNHINHLLIILAASYFISSSFQILQFLKYNDASKLDLKIFFSVFTSLIAFPVIKLIIYIVVTNTEY